MYRYSNVLHASREGSSLGAKSNALAQMTLILGKLTPHIISCLSLYHKISYSSTFLLNNANWRDGEIIMAKR